MSLLERYNETGGGGSFALLSEIADAAQFGDDDQVTEARDVLVRLLDEPEQIEGFEPLVNDLLASVGLFPYVDIASLDTRGSIQHALYDSPVTGRVFHRVQAEVFNLIRAGKNVVLSAPTSFGKSAILDAILVDGRFNKVVIIVPTIALIDETRRRLRRLPHDYAVVTQPSQELPDRFVAVLTQERALDLPEPITVDFFAIDEFYKLGESGDPQRSELLNAAFYRLWKSGAQFYLLGPNIEALADVPRLHVEFIKTDFRTVAANYIEPPDGDDDETRLQELVRTLMEPTLIYVQSPAQARVVADIVARAVRDDSEGLPAETASLIAWLSREYSDEWSVTRHLAHRVGVHHGRLPRSLGSKMVELFDAGELKFLVCTSTLIEGVNTAAKNVIIYSNRVANSRYDFFTFNNIAGRSGRMQRHFIGNIYLFHAVPEDILPSIDLPVFTQPTGTSDSLLLQVDDEHLSAASRTRVGAWSDQDEVPVEILRASPGVDPQAQVDVARHLRSLAGPAWQTLSWSGLPNRAQRDAVTNIVFGVLTPRGSGAVRTPRQLSYLLGLLQLSESTSMFIRTQLERRRTSDSVDDTIENSLEFLRNWAGFHLPRALSVLERVQHHVARGRGGPEADYGYFAARLEQYFLPYPAVLLEEYGIPVQIGSTLLDQLGLGGAPLDAVLERLRADHPRALELLNPVDRAIALAALQEL